MAPTSQGGVLIGKDVDHFGSPLDLAIDAFERVGRVQLGPVRGREAHIGQHVGLGLIQEDREVGQFGAPLVGDAPPLRPRRHGRIGRRQNPPVELRGLARSARGLDLAARRFGPREARQEAEVCRGGVVRRQG